MLKAAKISFSEMKKNIFLFGIINCISYIVLFNVFKYFNLLHFTGLNVIIDFIMLCLFSLYQIHRWIKQRGGYVPFLQAFCVVLFTGIWSFFLLGIFMYVSSCFDPYLAQQFNMESDNKTKLIGAVLVFFEGVGGSIIIALIALLYASRYEEGEKLI